MRFYPSPPFLDVDAGGANSESDPAYSPEVSCESDKISITVNKEKLEHLDISGFHAGMDDAENKCQPEDADGKLYFNFPLQDCNPTISEVTSDLFHSCSI